MCCIGVQVLVCICIVFVCIRVEVVCVRAAHACADACVSEREMNVKV